MQAARKQHGMFTEKADAATLEAGQKAYTEEEQKKDFETDINAALGLKST